MILKKTEKKLISALVCLLCCIMLTGTASAKGIGWYCVHVKDHIQPKADSRLHAVTEHGGYYIDFKNSSPTAVDKVVYLTFDAGYTNENLEKIIDILKEENVSGAFFILGNLAKNNPETVKRMADGGNLVCNHSYSHKDMSDMSKEQIALELGRLEKECQNSEGIEVAKYFRPPEGKFSLRMLDAVSDLGYKTIFWSFAYADWDNDRQPSESVAKSKILDNIHNGAVILLHPTSAANAAVLKDVIRTLKADGYRFGSLDELVES
jgi:peptidoglycan-N-acetylmuramic acid deacetylase